MIQFIDNQNINKKKWDHCIDHSVNARIYAYSWYLNIVAPDWGALILDDYQAVFPVVSRKKMGVSYAFQPVFTQQLGLFTPLLLTPQLVESFLNKLISLFPLVQINLNSHNKLNPNFSGIKKYKNHELDLIIPYHEIQKNYSKNVKRNLKKAQIAQLNIFKNIKPEAISSLFRSNKGKEIKKLTDHDYQKLHQLIYKAMGIGKAEVWGVFTKENNLCAGAIFVKDNHRHIFLFSATNQEARENGAMTYLIDAYLEANAGTKNIFDFEGSNDANLARFYKSFGSQLVHYPHIYRNKLPWFISIPLKMKQKFA